jgi:hypothetical protein
VPWDIWRWGRVVAVNGDVGVTARKEKYMRVVFIFYVCLGGGGRSMLRPYGFIDVISLLFTNFFAKDINIYLL